MTSWLPTLLKDAGFTVPTAALVTSLFQLGGTVGSLLVGWLMDRIGPHRNAGRLLCVRSNFALPASRSRRNTSPYSPAPCWVRASSMSGSQTPLLALCAAFYPTAIRATGVSWMSGIGRWGGVLGAYIGGPLLAFGWGFRAIFLWLTLPALLAAGAVATKGAVYKDPREPQPLTETD